MPGTRHSECVSLSGLRFRVQDLGLKNLKFRVLGLGFEGLWFLVSRFRV